MDKKVLLELYLRQHLSQRAVSKQLGVSQSTVRYYLKKFSIKRNLPKPVYALGTKPCPHCGNTKELCDFYMVSGRVGSWCKQCMCRQVIERQHKFKRAALTYLGGVCSVCGYYKCSAALEFHHPNPADKTDNINKLIRKKLSTAAKCELDKCIILCANCHREAHQAMYLESL